MDICLGICLKNSVKAAIGDIGTFLSPHALKSLNDIERIQLRMICASFNGSLCTTIIFYYSPTNASDEMDLTTTFYNELSPLV